MRLTKKHTLCVSTRQVKKRPAAKSAAKTARVSQVQCWGMHGQRGKRSLVQGVHVVPRISAVSVVGGRQPVQRVVHKTPNPVSA